MFKKWINSKTLSSRSKDFQWKYDDCNGLEIRRMFKGNTERRTIFTTKDIDKIINFVFKNGKVSLANNVGKLKNGIEKKGLGKFIYEELGRDVSDAQATSQLAAIFVLVKIFEYNGKLKNMEFWLNNINWRDKLNQYMNQQNNDVTFKAKLNHITYSVENLEKSILFYEKALNAKLVAKGERLAYFDLNGIWLALNVENELNRKEISKSYTHIAFEVDEDELKERFEILLEFGAEIEHGRNRNKREGESLYVKDPDGHLLEFHTSNLDERLSYYREEREDIEVYI